MKTVSSILFLSLLTITAQTVLPQTRPRRAEQTAAEPSPSPTSNTDAQDVGEVVRVDTNLVTVPVSVRDRNGRYIPNLQQQDFHIFEDGVEQDIAYFAAVEKPFTVVLLLDTSASTWSKLGQIKDAAKAFVEELRPNDQVMVISFGMGVRAECEATSDRQKIRKCIGGTSKGLSTHLYDAMDKLMKKHLIRIQGRKAVVLFTDGVDATSNKATYESTIHTAEELDALIYSIRYDTYDPAADKGDAPDSLPKLRLPGILGKIPLPSIGNNSGGGAGSSRADYDRGERYLHDLAELTGGRVYEASKDLHDLQIAFSNIADELGRQYSIGYYPKKKGQIEERRQIKVRVNMADVAVHARDKYTYKGPSSVTTKPGSAPAQDKSSPTPPVLQKKPFVEGSKVYN